MRGTATPRRSMTLLALFLAGGVLAALPAHAGDGTDGSATPAPPRAAKKRLARATTSDHDSGADFHARRGLTIKRTWGIDIVAIHPVSSGLMLRFDYRVVDPDKAAVLTDRRTRPYLIDEATRTALAIPAMEKVGELRQIAKLEENRTYFMIFGNPGRLVKHGSRVTLVAGNLKVEGLVVN